MASGENAKWKKCSAGIRMPSGKNAKVEGMPRNQSDLYISKKITRNYLIPDKRIFIKNQIQITLRMIKIKPDNFRYYSNVIPEKLMDSNSCSI